jgi:hypothetical protein
MPAERSAGYVERPQRYRDRQQNQQVGSDLAHQVSF